MKHIFIIINLAFLLTACTNRNASKTTNTSNAEINKTGKKISKAEKLATKICDCLKPIGDLQQKFENQKISTEEYGSQLATLSTSMQDCTNKLTEETEDKPDLKDEVLFKMKQICPKVSEIIVPAQ